MKQMSDITPGGYRLTVPMPIAVCFRLDQFRLRAQKIKDFEYSSLVEIGAKIGVTSGTVKKYCKILGWKMERKKRRKRHVELVKLALEMPDRISAEKIGMMFGVSKQAILLQSWDIRKTINDWIAAKEGKGHE